MGMKADLGKAIREGMERSGLSLQELARQSGVAAGILSRFARGQRDLRLETASKLCAILGLELRPKRPKKRR